MTKKLNIIKPDYLSLVTQQVAIGFEETGTIFSTGSSFFYEFNERTFLITNWHNVTGRNPITKEPLSKSHAGIPDIFITYLRLKEKSGHAELNTIKLYNDNEMTKPKWLIHPEHKEKVDVVAIEIDKEEKYVYSSINKADFDDDIPPEVGDECFVIGYPFEDFRYLGLPIWKKASIATEPSVNEDQLPKLLIDTATRPGLSGAPVIYQRIGIHKAGPNGQLNNDSLIGRIRGFLGIYSGRIGKGELQAQLGIVWKEKVILEIIEGNLKSDIEFQKK
jgi:S1-C subfamily serine protease